MHCNGSKNTYDMWMFLDLSRFLLNSASLKNFSAFYVDFARIFWVFTNLMMHGFWDTRFFLGTKNRITWGLTLLEFKKVVKYWKGYLPNLLEIWLLHQIFVFWVRDFKLRLLAYFLISFNCAKFQQDWTTLILDIL